MKKNETSAEEVISDEKIVDVVLEAIPKILSFLIVLTVGYFILSRLELYLESWLSSYFANGFVVIGIMLLIAFGPLFYLEEKIEKLISVVAARVMRKKLQETKVKVLEDLNKTKR